MFELKRRFADVTSKLVFSPRPDSSTARVVTIVIRWVIYTFYFYFRWKALGIFFWKWCILVNSVMPLWYSAETRPWTSNNHCDDCDMSCEPMSSGSASVPLIMVDPTSPVVVRRHQQATVAITVRGQPPPTVTWYVGRNRKPISTTTASDECFRHTCNTFYV